MKVKELRPESKVDTIEVTVTSKGDVREFTSRSGSVGKVCDCKAKDADGEEVQITLWNEEIDRVQPNDRIRISNGWVREWRAELPVGAGGGGRAGGLTKGGGWGEGRGGGGGGGGRHAEAAGGRSAGR